MRYRVNVSSQSGSAGGWSVLEADSAAVAVELAQSEWGSRFPVLDGVEEETHEPKTAYRVEVLAADGRSGDRVYKAATAPEIATELVLAQFPGLTHRDTYPDDPA